MRKQRNQKKNRCGRCKAVEKIAVRRAQFYKGVLIENLPATYCLNCGEELYSLRTAELMEQIAAPPKQYAKMVEMPPGARGLTGSVNPYFPQRNNQMTCHLGNQSIK